MRAIKLAVVCAFVLAIRFGSPARGEVILNTGGDTVVLVGARDTNVSFFPVVDSDMPTALPFVDVGSVIDGGSSGTSIYAFTDAGFNTTMIHSRAGLVESLAAAIDSIVFSVTEDTVYNISGSYAVTDDGEAHSVVFEAFLDDIGLNTQLYGSRQFSTQTANANFTLGGTDGDAENILYGSATGVLLAGHQYRFIYESQIFAHATGGTASSVGFASLELTPVVPVPLAAWGGAGLLGLLATARAARCGRASGASAL